MSEIETPAAPATGAQSPVQTPPVAAPPPPAEDPNLVRMTSAQLKERLDETRSAAESKIAKELGVTVAEAKVILAAHKAKEDASKSDVERLTAEREALKAKAAELDRYRGAVEIRAKYELAALTEEQRAAVLKLAKDDPADQLTYIETLRPSWQAVAQAQDAANKASAEAARIKAEAEAKAAADAAAIAAKGAPLPPPADTSAASAAPAGAAPPDGNALATFEALRTANPVRAALFYENHKSAIDAAKRARATA